MKKKISYQKKKKSTLSILGAAAIGAGITVAVVAQACSVETPESRAMGAVVAAVNNLNNYEFNPTVAAASRPQIVQAIETYVSGLGQIPNGVISSANITNISTSDISLRGDNFVVAVNLQARIFVPNQTDTRLLVTTGAIDQGSDATANRTELIFSNTDGVVALTQDSFLPATISLIESNAWIVEEINALNNYTINEPDTPPEVFNVLTNQLLSTIANQITIQSPEETYLIQSLDFTAITTSDIVIANNIATISISDFSGFAGTAVSSPEEMSEIITLTTTYENSTQSAVRNPLSISVSVSAIPFIANTGILNLSTPQSDLLAGMNGLNGYNSAQAAPTNEITIGFLAAITTSLGAITTGYVPQTLVITAESGDEARAITANDITVGTVDTTNNVLPFTAAGISITGIAVDDDGENPMNIRVRMNGSGILLSLIVNQVLIDVTTPTTIEAGGFSFANTDFSRLLLQEIQ